MEKILSCILCFFLLYLCTEAAPWDPQVDCNAETFEYHKHWNGHCPNGTTWDDRTACCYGCPQCKSTVCRSDQHHFDKHWNGDCPSSTHLDVRTGCCVGCETCADTGTLPQADNPASVCKGALNHFHKYWDGQCPSGTIWDDDKGCCTGCLNCGPGWMQAPDCRGPCIPCPSWQFSSNLDNNMNCSICTSCSHLNRRQNAECSPVGDAVCGKCLDGFQEPEITKESAKVCGKVKYEPRTTTFSMIQKPNYRPMKGNKCSYKEGKSPPHWDGTCPMGAGLDHKSSCCLPCKKCGPGYMQSPDCLSSCQPCPVGTFSNHPVDNYVCIPCTSCDLFHRKVAQGCRHTADAKCGDCLFGFYSYHDDAKTVCLPCPGSSDPACLEFFQFVKKESLNNADNPKESTDSPGHLPLFGAMLIIMIIILALLTAALLFGYWRWKKSIQHDRMKCNLPIAHKWPTPHGVSRDCNEDNDTLQGLTGLDAAGREPQDYKDSMETRPIIEQNTSDGAARESDVDDVTTGT